MKQLFKLVVMMLIVLSTIDALGQEFKNGTIQVKDDVLTVTQIDERNITTFSANEVTSDATLTITSKLDNNLTTNVNFILGYILNSDEVTVYYTDLNSDIYLTVKDSIISMKFYRDENDIIKVK